MEESPNSACSWPFDEGQVEPLAQAEARVFAKAVTPIGTSNVPSKVEGPYLGEFPPGKIQSELLKAVLDDLRHKLLITPEFILEVSLPKDRVCNPPPGQITLYEVS